MQSIITKYHGAGNVRGSRITASTTSGKRFSFSYNSAKSADQNHKDTAITTANLLGWSGHYVGGAYDDKGAQIWVREWEDKRDSFTVESPEELPHEPRSQQRDPFKAKG